MKAVWDAQDDALSFQLLDDVPIEASAMLEDDPDLILDYDARGRVVGIEILRVSRHPAVLGALGVHA